MGLTIREEFVDGQTRVQVIVRTVSKLEIKKRTGNLQAEILDFPCDQLTIIKHRTLIYSDFL